MAFVRVHKSKGLKVSQEKWSLLVVLNIFTFIILNVKPNQRGNNLEQPSEKKRAREGRGSDTAHTFFFTCFWNRGTTFIGCSIDDSVNFNFRRLPTGRGGTCIRRYTQKERNSCYVNLPHFKNSSLCVNLDGELN